MPNYCVVGGCKSVANKELGISTYGFPKKDSLRRAWVRFVQQTRSDFPEPGPGAVVCSRHFKDDCFETPCVAILESRQESGFCNRVAKRKKLDAVPSTGICFPDRVCFSPPPLTVTRRRDGAVKKRERKRLVEEALSDSSLVNDSLTLQPEADETRAVADADMAKDIGRPTTEGCPVVETEVCHREPAEVSPLATEVCRPEPASASKEEGSLMKSTRVKCRSIGVQADKKPSRRVKGTNCNFRRPPYRSTAIQCSITAAAPAPPAAEATSSCTFPIGPDVVSSTPIKPSRKRRRIIGPGEDDLADMEMVTLSNSFLDSEKNDPTWTLETSYHMSEMDHTITDENKERTQEKKKRLFAISEEKLMELFRRCHKCGLPGATAEVTSTDGTQVRVQQTCLACEDGYIWKGQPMTGKYPAGNVSLSTAILCAGALPGKTLRVLKFWGLDCIAPTTFFTHQRKFLQQAVRNVWDADQKELLDGLTDDISLSGDARCDSMGHCAKYGSYSLHDTKENKIVCTELVQSTEVKSSYHMELEGLSRALHVVETAKPDAKIKLTTDGHKSVGKWLREEKAEKVSHHFDIWHVSKGLWKKLLALSKRFPLVAKWMKSIRSHLYWCALSSDGDAKLMVAKWKSIVNHIANIHVHDDEHFPACAHGKLYRQWFDIASQEYDAISKILLGRELLKAVAKLSPDGQTSGLEGFHGTVIHFAPKMYHFGYNGMKTRMQLAALHFNENAGRAQRVTKDGKACEAINFPKSKKGGYVVRAVRINPTYGYAERVAEEVEKLVISNGSYEIHDIEPPALCAGYTRPDKEQAVRERKTHGRYRKQE